MAATKRDRAIVLAEKICNALTVDLFDRMSPGTINKAIADLHTLQPLLGTCSDINLAIGYLKKMKRPRADKQDLGQRAKYAAVGVKSMAYSMEKTKT